MTRAIANPLQSLIAQAAATPRITGEAARAQARFRPAGAHVILLDVSDSMASPAGSGARIDHLRGALAQVVRPDHRLIAFASHVTPMRTVADLPSPGGGTCLELALDAASQHDPAETLVVSDGEPTSPDAALAVARRLPGRINVLYCGDESNAAAIAFMRQLARLGAGRMAMHRWTGPTRLAGTMQQLLLAGPATRR